MLDFSKNIITIDGPAASGKGTIASHLATILGWHILPSGSIYRALALQCDRQSISSAEEDRIAALIEDLEIEFSLYPDSPQDNPPNNQSVQLRSYLLNNNNGKEETKERIDTIISTLQIGKLSSQISAHPRVREGLLAKQRAFAKAPGLVAEGRDMGSVVFPDAELKIFLQASIEERAKRRVQQLSKLSQASEHGDKSNRLGKADSNINKGDESKQGLEDNPQLKNILEELAARDQRDLTRAVAPLVPAKDAIVIDSTALSVDETIQQILSLHQSSAAKSTKQR